MPVAKIEAGGTKTYNQHERCVVGETQRRQLSNEGVLGKITVRDSDGNPLVIHNPTMYRHEIARVLDDPEFVSFTGSMSHRNPNALGRCLKNFKAHLGHRCSVYSFLRCQDLSPRGESSSREGHAHAENLRGTQAWGVFSQQSGFKHQTLEERGNKTHCAPMSCDVDTYGRTEKGATE